MSDASSSARRRPSGLGRGLSALLGDISQEHPVAEGTALPEGVRTLPIASIAPHPDQPRRHFDEEALDELADSIRERGVLQPIMVRRVGDGYQIVAGERRWRAAQRARLHEIPALIRDLSETETLEIAIIENIQRQDLNVIEEAEAYHRLMREFGHSQEALGRLVNKSRSHVANLLRLLDLPETVRGHVVEGSLTMGHARALVTADDPADLADQVIRRGLTVRDTERLARVAKGGTGDARGRGAKVDRGGAASADGAMDADLLALQTRIGELLGLAVQIGHEPGGSGHVTLRYSTLDQLDMIFQRLTGEGF